MYKIFCTHVHTVFLLEIIRCVCIYMYKHVFVYIVAAVMTLLRS